jgi:hypothetical protein
MHGRFDLALFHLTGTVGCRLTVAYQRLELLFNNPSCSTQTGVSISCALVLEFILQLQAPLHMPSQEERDSLLLDSGLVPQPPVSFLMDRAPSIIGA